MINMVWNKSMDYEALKHYASWLVNQMENTLDDYKYMEYEEILFSVNMDIKELEEKSNQLEY